MYRICAAKLTDIALIKSVIGPAWRATYMPILEPEQVEYMLELLYHREELKRLIQSGEQRFRLIGDGEEIFGFAAWSVVDANTCKLNKLYLDPQRKGSGAGKTLLRFVEVEVESWGAKELILNVNRYNPSFHFYQKMGYEVREEVDIPIGPYWMNDYVMVKSVVTAPLIASSGDNQYGSR
ncbi:MAG TPA: GNAT family N-acetyltransferase [Luteibaculaceae bacterium]|nr:GNAT family N-acetyltransferase [Luteibaculaceae bacterium]